MAMYKKLIIYLGVYLIILIILHLFIKSKFI